MTVRVRTHGMAGFRTDEIAARGRKTQDHRASAANAGRRETRGEPVTRCPKCQCETDIPVQAHSIRCAG